MVRDVSEWLETLKLGQYAKAFADNDVDRDLLLELSEDDLVKLGVTSLGHRKRLFKEIAALRARERADRPTERPQEPESAERRQLTVMFCDLVGSTELSGRLDPEDLREVLRRYQHAVTAAVTHYGGHVGQYLGDGVLVYFGWPRAFEDQAGRAVAAALDSIANVKQVRIDDTTHLNARVGIASGPVVIGEFVDHTGHGVQAVTGKTPNLAARLQGEAQPGQVVIDEHTRRLVGTAFAMEDLGKRELKGFPHPVSLWQVVGRGKAGSRFAALHSEGWSRFVGRKQELSLLQRRWARARKSKGQVVMLSGDAGIGKSRLIQAFHDDIAGEPCRHLTVQCSPLHTNSAFHPIIEFLERSAAFTDDDSEEVKLDKLEALLGRTSKAAADDTWLIARLLSLPGDDRYGPSALSPQQIRDHTIALLVTLLVDLGRRQPVVFLLEDMHWIDPTTETLVGEAMSRIAEAPVLILVTHRPEYEPPWSRQRHMAKVDLDRLSRDQGTELVRASGGDSLPDSTVVKLLARADGVPLYIEELTRSLLESDAAEIPTSLQASLVARLDRLGDAAKVAQLAALLGRSFHYRFIRAVSELDDADLDGALAAMTDADLLSQTGTPPRAVYAFRHALIQDAAYETLLKKRRARYHGKVAHVLLDEFPDQASNEPELVARHFSLAGQPECSVGFWLMAGQRASERSAHVEAVAHLKKGLQDLELHPDPQARDELELDLRVAIGASLATLKGWSSPEVEENYQRAHEIGASGADTQKLLLTLGGLANVYMIRGEIERARVLADKELSIAEEQADADLALSAHRFVGMCSFLAGEFHDSLGSFQRGNPGSGRAIGDFHRTAYGSDPTVFSLCIIAWTKWFLGEFEDARKSIQAALELAEQLRHPFSLAYARSISASVHLAFRDPNAVREHAEAANAIAETHDFPYWLGWSQVMLGWAQSALGNPGTGIDTMCSGLEVYESTGARQIKPYILTLLAEMHGRSGSPDEGLKTLNGAYGPNDNTDVRFYKAEALRIYGELLRQSGSDDGQAYFDRALELAARQGARALELRAAASIARASIGRRNAESSQRRLAGICQSFDADLNDPDLVDARNLLIAPQSP